MKAALMQYAQRAGFLREDQDRPLTGYELAKWYAVWAGLHLCEDAPGSVDDPAVFTLLKNRAIAEAEALLTEAAVPPSEREVSLDDDLPEPRDEPLEEAIARTLDLEARLEALADPEVTPPGERAFLAAWQREPDASIAEIARRLGLAASTGRTYKQRLVARAAGL